MNILSRVGGQRVGSVEDQGITDFYYDNAFY